MKMKKILLNAIVFVAIALISQICEHFVNSGYCQAWIIPAAMAAMSAASSIIGGSKAASAARKQQEMLQDQKIKNDALFDRQINQDYADTSAGFNLRRSVLDSARKNLDLARGEAAVTGNDAVEAAAKDKNNEMIAQSAGNIAAVDSQRKDALSAQKAATDQGYANQQVALSAQKAQATQQAAQGISNSLMSAAVNALGASGVGGTSKAAGAKASPAAAGSASPVTDVWKQKAPSFFSGGNYSPLQSTVDKSPLSYWQ
jgi:hypothetical protein